MNIKPAALIYSDAAGKLAGEAMLPAQAIETVRAMMKGEKPFPKGAVKVWAISGRGIEKEAKPPNEPDKSEKTKAKA